jgi:hypothetical protein
MSDQQTKFIERRDEWLEDVSQQFHEVALKLDTDYYVFQTDCSVYNPDLLIIGINPGGGELYSKKLEEFKKEGHDRRPGWSLKYIVNTLTTKPDWEIANHDKGADQLRASFNRVFNERTGLKQTLDNAVMMNMFYFNTVKAVELENISIEARKECLNRTLEFIEILNPKNILFLTSDKKLLSVVKVEKTHIENNVSIGMLGTRTVYTIPHYNYYGAYKADKAELMGKTLYRCFYGKYV